MKGFRGHFYSQERAETRNNVLWDAPDDFGGIVGLRGCPKVGDSYV